MTPDRTPRADAPLVGSSRPARTLNDEHSDHGRRVVGLVLFVLFLGLGIALNAFGAFLQIATSKTPHLVEQALLAGMVPAFAMLVFYLPIPALLDRFDPEPWWCLALAFFWGALVATGCAGTVNTAVHVVASHSMSKEQALFVTTCVSAPITEEIMKGLGVLGFFFFLRREFDGVVDGIIYATFIALGFAAVENVHYYADAALRGRDVFQETFVLRGVIAPWGHPLYTSMTGIGFGIARETSRPRLRIVAPLSGLLVAMLLHATWNFIPSMGSAVFVLSLLLWLAFVAAFVVMIVVLVARKGRIIRENLRDEVLFGTLGENELARVTSATARLGTFFKRDGREERRFLRAASRLALAKWHTARAMRWNKKTVSMELIGPLREEIQAARQAIVAVRAARRANVRGR